ncbi:spore germination protein [Bacillaceae bacterium W0354]
MTRRKKNSTYFPCEIDQLKKDLKNALKSVPDYRTKLIKHDEQNIIVCFLDYMVDKKTLYDDVIIKIQEKNGKWDQASLINELPLENGIEETKLEDIERAIKNGSVIIYIEQDNSCVSIPIQKQENRNIEKAETESIIFGPKLGFTESLYVNLNIVRNQIDNPNLATETFTVGKTVPTEVRLIYLESIANEEDVIEMRQRLKKLEIDDILEGNTLTQFIEDNSYSIFPQFLNTELPDRFCYSIKEGKIGLLVDKSPSGIIAPSNFLSFFESTEDLYTRWNMGSFIRILRILATFISIILTPTYVTALTYHYEIIPQQMLVALGHSRSRVPFSPLMEALILEIFIEFIREAGARLPTKVGQTMGIVGGIVIGQAIVQAGFTSNILIIVVALSALASFTAPSYLMGSAIRIIRFPLILLAGFWGILGLMFGVAFLSIHLLRQRSLNRPYLAPIYPLQIKDLDNSIFRLPFLQSNHRAYTNQPKKKKRFPEPTKKRKKKNSKDIDE